MSEVYSYTDFIKKNWVHVKDKPLISSPMTPQSNILEFRLNLIDLGIEVREDIIDWRVYSLLLFSIIARRRFKAVPAWVPERMNISRAEECYSLWDTIATDDPAEHFYNFKACIDDANLDVLSKIGLLLRCRFELHLGCKHAAYIPLYLSLYAKVIKIPHVLNKVVTSHRAWGVVSCLHYFPTSVAAIEYEAFPDCYNWFLGNFLIISNLLDEE